VEFVLGDLLRIAGGDEDEADAMVCCSKHHVLVLTALHVISILAPCICFAITRLAPSRADVALTHDQHNCSSLGLGGALRSFFNFR
jgi:hypothetical protein